MDGKRDGLETKVMVTVAAVAAAVTIKQMAFGHEPMGVGPAVLGTGGLLAVMEAVARRRAPYRKREYRDPIGPVPVGLARVPAVATIVLGAFCLFDAGVVVVGLMIAGAVANSRSKAKKSAGGPNPASPAPTPAPPPTVKKAKTARPLPADRPAAVAEPALAAVEPLERPPSSPAGLDRAMGSTLDALPSLSLESRLPAVLESRLPSMTGSMGLNGGASGFDEALALLQGPAASSDHAG